MGTLNKINFNEFSTIFHYIGQVCLILGIFMLIPIVVAIIYQEYNLGLSFLFSSIISISIGILSVKIFKKYKMSLKVAMLFSTLIWVIASFLGGLPYFFSGELSLINGFFEAISGFTTTGFSMFSSIETAGFTINFWRALTQWMGGLGIIFFMIVILKFTGSSAMQLYHAEGREERLVPSIKNTSKIIFYIYSALTIMGIILFLLSGISLFDSIFYTFVSLSTGGFALHMNSILHYNSVLVESVSMILMIAGSINFALLFLLVKKRFRDFFKDIEIKVAIILIPLAIIIVSVLLIHFQTYGTIFENIRFATFQVVSAISTTGLQTAFYPELLTNWHGAPFFILIILMIIGAGSCSTGGGIKWLRIGLLFKAINWQIKSFLLPGKTIVPKKIKHFNRLKVNNDILRMAGLFIFLYLIIYIISVILILCYYNNIPQAMFEVASAMGNVGLTSGILTPSSPDVVKIIFMLDFWVGRLEIWPVLMVLTVFLSNIKDKIKS